MDAQVRTAHTFALFVHAKHGGIFREQLSRQKIAQRMHLVLHNQAELIAFLEKAVSYLAFGKGSNFVWAHVERDRRKLRLFRQSRPRISLDIPRHENHPARFEPWLAFGINAGMP